MISVALVMKQSWLIITTREKNNILFTINYDLFEFCLVFGYTES